MKRNMVSIALVAVAVSGAFTGGLHVGAYRAQQKTAEEQLIALHHYVPVLAYLRKGDVNNAKSLIYTATDGPLSTFARDNGESLSADSRSALAKVLAPLNEAWLDDKPFEGAQWASVRTLPDWVEMRRRNDSFRKNYAAKP